MLTNDDVTLRAIERYDLMYIREWRNEPYFRQFMREYRELTETHQENWYNRIVEDDRFKMFVITSKESIVQEDKIYQRRLVGVAGLTYIDWRNKHCDVHFCIADKWAWIDDVYAPKAIKILLDYAFNTLNMNKVWAEVYEIDEKKLKFFKGLGFQVDASLREHYYYEGKYITSYILSLLKSEYLESNLLQ